MPIDFISLFELLNKARSRFVVVGGLAVVLHGFDRLTSDADLIVDLSAENAANTIRELTNAGYRPLAPVDPLQFADPAIRDKWVSEKGMKVFSLWDTQNLRPNVDLFVSLPIPFEEFFAQSVEIELRGSKIRLASLEHLIVLKRLAGRDRDMADIAVIESRLNKDRQ